MIIKCTTTKRYGKEFLSLNTVLTNIEFLDKLPENLGKNDNFDKMLDVPYIFNLEDFESGEVTSENFLEKVLPIEEGFEESLPDEYYDAMNDEDGSDKANELFMAPYTGYFQVDDSHIDKLKSWMNENKTIILVN